MQKTNTYSLVSFILAIIGIVLALFYPDPNTIIIGTTLCIIIGIISIVLASIGNKKIKTTNEKGKGFGIASIIISVIVIIFAGLALFGAIAMKSIEYNDMSLCLMEELTKNCVDNNDGTSTCEYGGVYEIPCSTDVLKEEQFKNEN